MTTETLTVEGLEALADLEEAIATAPPVVYFHVRNALQGMAIDHRTTFLRRLPIRLARKRGGRDSISTPKVGEPVPDDELDRSIRWSVHPAGERMPNATSDDLDALYLEALTRATVLAGYEAGITIRPRHRKKLAVPITAPGAKGRGRQSPAEFREKNPRAVLIARKSKASGALLLFERKRKRSKDPRKRAELGKNGKPRAKQRGRWVDTLIPRWALLDQVDLRRSLGFYQAWDSNRGKRAARLTKALRYIVRDISAGVRD